MTPDARSLLASLTDEEAEVVLGMARWVSQMTHPKTPAARSAIAKLRRETP